MQDDTLTEVMLDHCDDDDTTEDVGNSEGNWEFGILVRVHNRQTKGTYACA